MVLLPEKPMKRRYFDEHVGWFAKGQLDYGLKYQESKTIKFLDRCRLEVKNEVLEKFKNGKLVEPKKQIRYFMDRATPKNGFRSLNKPTRIDQLSLKPEASKIPSILSPPSHEEDPEWSSEDVRHSVVRYPASPIPNTNRPLVNDPSSEEILDS